MNLLEQSLSSTLSAAGLDASVAPVVVRGGRDMSLQSERKLGLMVIDFDQIQRTVLASPRPVTIFGASLHIQRWDLALQERTVRSLPKHATVLFAGGGNAVLLVPAQSEDHLRELADAIVAELKDHTLGSATAAWRLVSPKELAEGPPQHAGDAAALKLLGLDPGGSGFGALLGLLARELRTKKGADRPHTLEAPLEGVRCSECALRPRNPGSERCERCDRYRDRGGKEKRFAKHEQARTFEDVLAKAHARKIAFLHIDGRGIGGALASLRSLGEYHQVSNALRRGFELSDERAHRLGLRAGEFQVVLRGGDDLLLVLPAATDETNVLDIAVRLLRDVEASMEGTPLAGQVGAGAGLVVSNGLPADFAFGLAHKLCDRSKQALRRTKDERSAIDFAVIAGGSTFSESGVLDDERNVALGTGRGTEKVRISQRPYVLSRFERLLQAARRLEESSVGRSALMRLREALEQRPESAALTWAYQMARDAKLREALDAQLARPLSEISEWLFAPTGEDRVPWATAVPDLIEVMRIRRGR